MKRKEKPIFVENLAEELSSASSALLIDYTGLTVSMQQTLQKELKKVGAKMLVVKNTLLKLAARKAKIDKSALSDTVLTGPTAVVISEGDPVSPLQVIFRFAKEFEIPTFKVGLVEGLFQDKEGLTKLAQLPPREILLGNVAGTIAGPMYGLVAALQGNLQKLLFILREKTKDS